MFVFQRTKVGGVHVERKKMPVDFDNLPESYRLKISIKIYYENKTYSIQNRMNSIVYTAVEKTDLAHKMLNFNNYTDSQDR